MRNLLAVLLLIIVGACNSASSNRQNNSTALLVQKTPEQFRAELKGIESTNPSKYLMVDAGWRKNWIGEIVLEGTIRNTATLANFKDVILDVTWISKTQTEMGSDRYPVYEFVNAGQSTRFKLKVTAPSKTAGVRMRAIHATAAN